MAQLQIALAVLGNGLTILLVVLLARDARRILAVRLAIPFFLCSIGYSLILLRESLWLPMPVVQVGVLLNAATAGLGWLFGRALLDDEFRLGRREWAALVALTALALSADLEAFGLEWPGGVWLEHAALVASFSVMAHLSWLAITGFRDDLVDTRRHVRGWFLLVMVLSSVVLIALDWAGVPVAWRGVAYDLLSTTINVTIICWAARLRLDRLLPLAEPGPARLPVKPRQMKAYRRLLALMEEEHVYREPGLSIGRLASLIGMPEHQLRALINKTLGHRNFAAFLNNYRLAEARAALADPELDKSILLIALDSGYQSLSTFNRAFRRQYDETPSDFRRRTLGQFS